MIGVHMDHSEYGSLLNLMKKLDGKYPYLQVFVGDNHHTTLSKKNQFSKEDFDQMKKYLKKSKMKLMIHGLLSLNFCFPPKEPRFKWGIDNLVHDLSVCKRLGGRCGGVVIHLGGFQTPSIKTTYEECMKNFVESLQMVCERIKGGKILLETSINRPYTIGGTIESLAELYEKIPKKIKSRIGFCLDTCHIFSAGYPIHTIEGMKDYFAEWDRLIGLEKIKLIHLNDSKEPFHSIKDRHESIGKGYIFGKKLGGNPEVLGEILKVAKKRRIPVVLETDPDGFQEDIKMVKKMMGGNRKDWKPKIVEIFEKILMFHKTLGKKGNMQTKFRISSYEKILRSIKSSKPIYTMEDVEEIPGIGKNTKEKIEEIMKTGKLHMLEEIEKNPDYQAIYEMQGIWGIGVEKAQQIVLEDGIHTIRELRNAVKEGKVTLNEQQMKGLEYYEELSERIPRREITQFTKWIQKRVKKYGIKVVNAGSYRLGKKESGDIDLLFVKKNVKNHTSYAKAELFQNVIDDLREIILYIFSQGNEKMISIIQNPLTKKIRQMDIMMIDEEELPWYLLYFGSDKEFSKKIRKIAIDKGYKLSEKGIFDRKTGKRIDFYPKEEKEIFTFLEIPYVPPSERIII